MAIRVSLRVALAAVCLAGVVVCTVVYVSHVRLTQAFDNFQKRQDFGATVRDLHVSESPLNPNIFRDVGIAYSLLALNHPVAAERVIAAAVRREPRNLTGWVVLTRIQVSRGRRAAARASWVRARRVDPHLPPELPPGSPYSAGAG